ncbi:MAG TPA: hypothetical protein VN861_03105 [Candidatus Acidoferrales bacterium]|nr:hypothetical protein [Candidatus Acidoferrales bacterium]
MAWSLYLMKDITDKKFGRLTARWPVGKYKDGAALWLCSCDCGKLKVVMGSAIRRLVVRSCGCLVADRAQRLGWGNLGTNNPNFAHGYARKGKQTPEYKTWTSMINRCQSTREKTWKIYGGRGITVCGRWRSSFRYFLADMGTRPEGMTLDRIDNDKGYEPGNCRWATPAQQSHNRRVSRHNYMPEASGDPSLMSAPDGAAWAHEFASMAKKRPAMAADLVLLTEWFNAAIRAGRKQTTAADEELKAMLLRLSATVESQAIQ